MDKQKGVLYYAQKLESILRKYLNCEYGDFDVKANDNFTMGNWQKSIIFALGCRYGSSQQDPKVKEDIDYFLNMELIGKNIGDVVERYEYYGFDTKEAAFDYISETIEHLKKILLS